MFEKHSLSTRKENEDYIKFHHCGVLIKPKKNSRLAKDTREEVKQGLEPSGKQDQELSEDINLAGKDDE